MGVVRRRQRRRARLRVETENEAYAPKNTKIHSVSLEFFASNVWKIVLFHILMYSMAGLSFGIPINNGLVTSEKTECMNGKTVDLVFIMDGSGSIGDSAFDKQKAFVNMVVSRLDIADNATRVAVVQYSDEPLLEFAFGQHSNRTSVKSAVSKLQYITGTTRTGEALRFANRMTFDRSERLDSGPSASKAAIVITDGRAQDDVAEPAEELRAAGVVIYAIGVANFIDVGELLAIAGAQQRVFTVDSYEQLDQSFSALLTKELCKTTYQGGVSDIVCSSDSIGITARTRQPFEGNVFVKGYFHTKTCRMSAESFAANPTLVSITVPFNDCGLNPRGVFVETVVVFSFHPRFLTKVDQAIKIQCFYMEAQKTVQSDLEVSMFTPADASKNVPMPVCHYSLRKEDPNGPLVRYAFIGEPIFHRWECIQQDESHDLFGMLVHSCYVDDGEGNQVQLLDSKGCGLDIHLLGTPEYNTSSARLAFKETHVFKFADKPVLQFQCQITICAKTDGSCSGVTPPDCSTSTRTQRKVTFHPNLNDLDSLDVITNSLTVFDKESDMKAGGQLPNFRPNTQLSSHTCIAHRTLLLGIGCTIFMYLMALSFVAFSIRRRRQA